MLGDKGGMEGKRIIFGEIKFSDLIDESNETDGYPSNGDDGSAHSINFEGQ